MNLHWKNRWMIWACVACLFAVFSTYGNAREESTESPIKKPPVRSLFWQPEPITNSSINSLKTIYWEPASRLSWTTVWGWYTIIMLVVLILAAASAGLRKSLDEPYCLVLVMCAFMFLYDAHFLLRFWPNLNRTPGLSSEEKIRRNYKFFDPEFGEFVVQARERIPLDSKVIIAGRPWERYTAQTLAFNLAPRRCGYIKKPHEDGYWGISGYNSVLLSEADYYVSYCSPHSPPNGFEREFELSPETFLAKRGHPGTMNQTIAPR